MTRTAIFSPPPPTCRPACLLQRVAADTCLPPGAGRKRQRTHHRPPTALPTRTSAEPAYTFTERYREQANARLGPDRHVQCSMLMDPTAGSMIPEYLPETAKGGSMVQTDPGADHGIYFRDPRACLARTAGDQRELPPAPPAVGPT